MAAVRTAGTITLVTLAGMWAPLDAQHVPGAGYPAVFVGVGAFDYSLRADGRSAMFAGRVEQHLTNRVIGEAGVLYARVRQPGLRDATNYFIPELQVHVQLGSRRFAPYLGVGGGMTVDFRPDSVHTNATASASVGFRAWFSELAALRSEFRIRAVGGRGDGGGSSRELVLGLLLRLIDPED